MIIHSKVGQPCLRYSIHQIIKLFLTGVIPIHFLTCSLYIIVKYYILCYGQKTANQFGKSLLIAQGNNQLICSFLVITFETEMLESHSNPLRLLL